MNRTSLMLKNLRGTFLKMCIFSILIFGFNLQTSAQSQKDQNPTTHTNALINESSAYLRQHASNPVNWFPWNSQALSKAKNENKLIVLSIGFSSCHWCHVMNEETFEDAEVAAFMNENFISIKVDREEKPDVDQIYMTAYQLMKDNGGWPLNMILLPDGKPIYGSTYLPKKEWVKMLDQLLKLFEANPEQVNKFADDIISGIKNNSSLINNDSSNFEYKEVLNKSILKWKTSWDLKNGGEGNNQKFAKPVNLDFLLDYVVTSGDQKAEFFLKQTLDAIATKGLYDHVKGGFFRYSTDAEWSIPHFEKMLYDNAQLVSTYSKAYRFFKNPVYKDKVFETLSFIEREMKNKSGGYASSLNADTAGEEGGSYYWNIEELKKLIPENEFELFSEYYALNKKENTNKYLLIPDLEKENQIDLDFKLEPDQFSNLKLKWRNLLVKEQELRESPGLDTKVITSWNALLVTSYIEAYKTFQNPEFLERGKSLFKFLTDDYSKKGRLNHILNSEVKEAALYLQDYAYLLDAALNLYEVTLDDTYFIEAQNLEGDARKLFLNSESIFYNYSNANNLLTSIYKTDDGVLPSGNAVMAYCLFKQGTLLSNEKMLDQYATMLSALKFSCIENPSNYGLWNNLILYNSYPFYELVIVGEEAQARVNEIFNKPISNAFVYGSLKESNLKIFENRYEPSETWIYVCTAYNCKLPVREINHALQLLQQH